MDVDLHQLATGPTSYSFPLSGENECPNRILTTITMKQARDLALMPHACRPQAA